MRHQRTGRNLGRDSSHRKSLIRNMVTSLFKHEQLETTDAKAKELRPVVEKMITLAKRGDLHARRTALSYIKEKPAIHKLFDELKGRYADRKGGYTRIIKKGIRKGDGAPISIIQLLPADEGKKKGKTTEKAKDKTKAKTKDKAKARTKTKAEASESAS